MRRSYTFTCANLLRNKDYEHLSVRYINTVVTVVYISISNNWKFKSLKWDGKKNYWPI